MLTPSLRGKKKKQDTPSLYQEGMNLIQGSLFKQATQVLIQALQDNPEQVTQQLVKAFNEANRSEHYEAAVAIGDALLEKLNDKAGFLVNLGNCYRHLGEYKQANDLYRKALRVDKSNTLALLNLGASLARVEKFDADIREAIEPFQTQKHFILPPYLDDPDIIEKLTKALEKERDEQQMAIDSMIEEKQRQQASGNLEAVKELIIKIEQEERKQTIPLYQAIVRKLRKTAQKTWAKQTIEESKLSLQRSLYNIGLYALSQNDTALAEESFAKLEADHSSLDHLQLLLAIVEALKGNLQRAIERLIAQLKHHPSDRYLYVNLGLMYQKQGNKLLSIRYLLTAANLLESSGGLFDIQQIETRAEEYFQNEQFSEALELFHIVVKETPSARAWDRIGEILLKNEEMLEATMAFHEALELDPGHSNAKQKLLQIHDTYWLKADTQFRNGYYAEAITLYQNALEVHPSVEVMKKAIRAYEKMNDFTQVNALKSRIEALQLQQKQQAEEENRVRLIEKGKQLMKQKRYNDAIELLEKAFEMKPDKDTFLLLAHTLKAFKQKRKLSGLVQRWRQLMERESDAEHP